MIVKKISLKINIHRIQIKDTCTSC